MQANGQHSGIFWVVLVDVLGIAILIAALAAAGGAPALKDWMFVLMSCLPVAAAVMLYSTRLLKPAPQPVPARGPVVERRIVIAPRPIDSRRPVDG